MFNDLYIALHYTPADQFSVRALTKPLLLAIIFVAIYIIIKFIHIKFIQNGVFTRKRIVGITGQAIGYSVPIVLLAFVAGYLTGISRSPAVGAVVPAVLTMIGALNVFVFGFVKSNVESKIAVGYTVFLFSTMFFYGHQTGGYWREYFQQERLVILSKQESFVRDFRKNLGLPEDPASWIWPYEAGSQKDLDNKK